MQSKKTANEMKKLADWSNEMKDHNDEDQLQWTIRQIQTAARIGYYQMVFAGTDFNKIQEISDKLRELGFNLDFREEVSITVGWK